VTGPGQDGEKGLGATLLGGASGGFLAHEVGGGLLGTLVGSVAGAIGANALEKKHKKSKEGKKHKSSSDGYGSAYGSSSAVGGLYPESSHGHGHGKHHRHHSRSRSRGVGSSGSSSDSD
jgi:hypothetical protein